MNQGCMTILSQPENIMKALLVDNHDIKFCWLGNDGWVINNKECTVAFDLDLLDQSRLIGSPVEIKDLAPYLDYLLITHAHNDHFHDETAKELNLKSNCMFILPESCLEKASELGIPKNRIIKAVPGEPLKLKGLEVEPIRALHGHLKNSVYMGANLKDCGYILNLGPKRIYQPGDTVLLHEQLEMKNIDVLFVSPTEHNTQVIPSVSMIEAIDPKVIIPQHFGTYPVDGENYFWTRGYPDELYEALSDIYKQRFVKLSQGEVLKLRINL